MPVDRESTTMFELRDLECFMEIVEHRNFGRAAGALGIAQPVLSRRIARLERHLGMQLFSRVHRQIDLTAGGRIFAREATAVLARAAIAGRVLDEASHGTKGNLRVGTRSSSRYVVILEALRRFRTECPGISVSLHDLVPSVGLHAVRKGELDLTVVRGPVTLYRDLRIEQLRSEPLMVALPDGHPRARASVISVGDLNDEPFIEIAADRARGYKELVRGMCADAGFVPNVVQEADTLASLAMCVAAGMGIALMHDASRELPIPGVVYRPLIPETTVTLQAVWRAGNENPAIAPFVRHLKEVAQRDGHEAE
jgi:DNA-binding transcriptional LysR family regulator